MELNFSCGEFFHGFILCLWVKGWLLLFCKQKINYENRSVNMKNGNFFGGI